MGDGASGVGGVGLSGFNVKNRRCSGCGFFRRDPDLNPYGYGKCCVGYRKKPKLMNAEDYCAAWKPRVVAET